MASFNMMEAVALARSIRWLSEGTFGGVLRVEARLPWAWGCPSDQGVAVDPI